MAWPKTTCAELIGEYVKALPKYIKGSYLDKSKWKAADNKKELKNYVLQFKSSLVS